MIPYGKHYIDDEDIKSVTDVLKNGFLTQGPEIEKFEKKIAEYVGASYAVAVSSATAALHLSCIVSGVDKNNSIITSPNTFVASSNSALYCGGKAYFTDINLESQTMCIDSLIDKLNENSDIKVVMPVHFSGLAIDIERIYEICNERNITIIEDAAHALGGSYLCGDKVGSCKYSLLTCFSFHPVKGVTSGEGGVITTNCEDTFKKLLKLRSHGICKGNFDFPGKSLGNTDQLDKHLDAYTDGKLNPWYYEMQELGYNYRITDFQAALALSQLKKIDDFIKRRREIASIYDEYFSRIDEIVVKNTKYRNFSSLHLYTIEINFEKLKICRADFMRKLSSLNIGTQVHYIPVPFHPYYEKLGEDINNYPNCLLNYERTLSIPIYYSLSNEQVSYVASSIIKTLLG